MVSNGYGWYKARTAVILMIGVGLRRVKETARRCLTRPKTANYTGALTKFSAVVTRPVGRVRGQEFAAKGGHKYAAPSGKE